MSWSWRRMWRDARIHSVMGMPSITNAQPVVRLRDVTRTYGQVVALAGISLDIHRGRFTAIMGPSGSGKSVLLKHVAGLETPTSGSVRIGEHDASDPATRDQVHLALVFQAGALFNSFTVYENLALYLLEHRILPPPER